MKTGFQKLEDEEILELLKAYISFNDKLAFEKIYTQYYKMVHRVALNIVGNFEIADEVAQEVFFKFSRRAANYDSNKAALSTYLFKIAKDEALLARERETKNGFFQNLKDLFYWGNRRLEKNLFAKEIEGQIAAAINTLPEVERQVFGLRFYADFSISEIAVELNLNENTVKTYLFKTKHLLVGLLGDIYFNSLD